MDLLAAMLSIEVTQRSARSALPSAEVKAVGGRWERLAAALRRIARPRGPVAGGEARRLTGRQGGR